jgi:hypothetical protein
MSANSEPDVVVTGSSAVTTGSAGFSAFVCLSRALKTDADAGRRVLIGVEFRQALVELDEARPRFLHGWDPI